MKINGFNEKTVVITGAASGMGRAYALSFAKRGAKLALCDFNKEELTETCELAKNISDTVQIYSEVFDVSNREQVFAFADNVKNELGTAFVVINNAGIEAPGLPAWKTTHEQMKLVMDVNFYGVINGTDAFLPQLMEANQGALVNVSSVFGFIGAASQSSYCASKFAVRGYTETLMIELSQKPIQIHLVHPGGINTNITKQEISQKFAKKYLTTSPNEIAEHVIKSIKKNKPRIVYGNESFMITLGSKIVPLKLLIKAIWFRAKDYIVKSDYE